MKTLEFKDLKRIADTVTYDNGFTTFYVNVNLANIKFLLLREILALKSYMITFEGDWDEDTIVFNTDVPADVFENL